MSSGAVPKSKKQLPVPKHKAKVADNSGVVAATIHQLHVTYAGDKTYGSNHSSSAPAGKEDTKAIQILENKARREYGNTCPSLICQHRSQECTRKSFFVEPTLYKQNVYGAPFRPLKYDKLFVSSRSYKREPKLILVTGNAGIGKSKLANRIVNDWAVRMGSPPSKFKLVVLFKLTELEANQSLQDCLMSRFEQSLRSELPFVHVETVMSGVRDQMLIVLDAYDELTSDGKDEVKDLLDKDSFFHSSTILVTSRPEAVNERFTKLFQRIVTIAPLSKEQRDIYVDKFFGVDIQTAKTVKQFLEYHQLRFLALECTELLFVISQLFEKGCVKMEHRDSEFIFNMTKVMVFRAFQKDSSCKSYPEDKLNEIAYRLGKLFLTKLTLGQTSLEGKDFDVFGSAKEAVKKSGLFQTVKTKLGNPIEVLSKAYTICLAVHYMNEKLTKLKTVSDVHAFLRKSLGESSKIKTLVFKKGLGYLVLWGTPKEVVYVTQGGHSIFNGSFETLLNVKDIFGRYVCKFKDPALPGYAFYSEGSSVISIGETFDQICDSDTKQASVHFRGSRVDEIPKLSLNMNRFSSVGYIRFAFNLEDKGWAPRVLKHQSCDQTCTKVNMLPEHILKEDFLKTIKYKSWNVVIHDKNCCFTIDNTNR